MQGNIRSGYSVMLPSQVILPSDVTLVSAFQLQGNIVSDFPAISQSQIIIASSDVVIAFSAFAIVRIRASHRVT